MNLEKENLLVLKLNEEFERRCQKNKRYSLRAFAHYLEVDPSNLSKILRGERIPSIQGVQLFLKKLALDEKDHSLVLSSVNQSKTVVKLSQKAPFRPLQEDIAETSQWLHFVLLEIIQVVKINESTIPRVAEAIGTSQATLQSSLDELVRWNFIKLKSTNGGYEFLSKSNTTMNLPYTSESLKAIQRVFLSMAASALDKYPLPERENTTLTIAVSTEQIPEIKKLLKATRQKLNRFSDPKIKKKPNAVYNISMALYPVFVERI